MRALGFVVNKCSSNTREAAEKHEAWQHPGSCTKRRAQQRVQAYPVIPPVRWVPPNQRDQPQTVGLLPVSPM